MVNPSKVHHSSVGSQQHGTWWKVTINYKITNLPHRAHYIDEVKSCSVSHDLVGRCSCSNGSYHGGKRNGHYRQCLAQRHLLLSKRGKQSGLRGAWILGCKGSRMGNQSWALSISRVWGRWKGVGWSRSSWLRSSRPCSLRKIKSTHLL